MNKKFTRFIVTVVAFVLALSTGIALVGCGIKGDEKEKTYFNVMSFNIRVQTDDDKGVKNWSNRRTHIYEYLKESNADVICMQEVTQSQAEDLQNGLDGTYEVVYYARENSGNPEGLAVCYNNAEFDLVEKNMFWLSETPDKMSKGWGANYYRICVNLLLKHKETGVYLDVYDVHLDHQVELARVNGLKLIMEKATAKGYPTVVAGDFNTVKESECYETISEKMYDCQATASSSDDGVTYHNWGKSVDELKSKSAIDFCFVSKDITPIEFDIMQDTVSGGVYYSDHYAISSYIAVEN